MPKDITSISDELSVWIRKQKIFFVSTAPLSGEGHVNCSPKGLDSFRIINANTVVYQDLTGSGVETIAHVKENGRMVIMFCAFEGPPKIVRLHGTGEIIEPHQPEFESLSELFPKRIGVRSYIKLYITRATDSCGYSVPKYQFIEDRDVLDKWCERKGEDGIIQYQKDNNLNSLDGLKGIER